MNIFLETYLNLDYIYKMKLLSFDEALNKTNNKKRVLLGNGFSVACRKDIFTYKALLEQADFSRISSCIPNIFKYFKTQDFELIIKKLLDSSIIINFYENNLKADSELLRNKKRR